MPRLRNVGHGLTMADPRIAAAPAKRADSLYLSKPWRDLVGRLIATLGRQCEACGRTGCRIYGDHVHELRDGGAPLDPSNVRLLCGSCHTAKTARVRAARTRQAVSPASDA